MVGIRFSEHPTKYKHQYRIGDDDDRIMLVHQSKSHAYLIPQKKLDFTGIIQGSENHFYTRQKLQSLFSLHKLMKIDLSQEIPVVKEFLKEKNPGSYYATSSDEVVFYDYNHSTWKQTLYIYIQKQLKIASSSSIPFFSNEQMPDNTGCSSNATISFDRKNLLCYTSKIDYIFGNYAVTTTVISLALDASATNGIASTSVVTEFFTPEGDGDFNGLNGYHSNTFIRSDKYLLLAQGDKSLFLPKIYPRGETKSYNYPEIADPADLPQAGGAANSVDDSAYRIYGDTLYLFHAQANGGRYELWKIDLTNMEAGATKINTDGASYSPKTAWFTDDKKVLWKGGSIFYRIDLTKTLPKIETISEFKNEVIRLIKLK